MERSNSGMSGISFGRQNSMAPEVLDENNTDAPVDYKIECHRQPSFEVPELGIGRRLSSSQFDDYNIFMARRQPSIMSICMDQLVEESAASPVSHIGDLPLSDEDDSDSLFEYSPMSSREESTIAPSTPSSPQQIPRRRPRTDSAISQASFYLDSQIDFDELDKTRPWEYENTSTLNCVPEGHSIPRPHDYELSLGDLRVIARFHVQRLANSKGIRLPAGMTNSDLVELADSLGLYPLMYRLHLEATGVLEMSDTHSLYLEYKKEAKIRAKFNKANKDLRLAEKTRLLPDGRVTIDYFDGISLRLGRERDTIFRPLLHRVFREHKDEIRDSLSSVGLNYSEMRKWRDTQLCTALHVADKFLAGVWQSAVDTHISKTKDFM